MSEQPTTAKDSPVVALIKSRIWWTFPILLFVLAILFSGKSRTEQFWDLDALPPDIVKLTADGSVSQISKVPPGALRGFAANVKATREDGQPIMILLRIRESGGDRTILRESTVYIESDGTTEISTGLLPPLILPLGSPIEYEIQVDRNSRGAISIIRSGRPNHPIGQLTINGSPTEPKLRASIVPISTLRTVSLVRAFMSWNLLLTLFYLAISFLLATGSIILIRNTLRVFLTRGDQQPPLIPLLISAIPVTAIALIVSISTFRHSSGRYYMEELADGFWAAVFAYLLLWSIGVLALARLTKWLGRARGDQADMIVIFTRAISWRSLTLFGLAILSLSIPALLLRLHEMAQVTSGAAVIILSCAILWRGITSNRSS